MTRLPADLARLRQAIAEFTSAAQQLAD